MEPAAATDPSQPMPPARRRWPLLVVGVLVIAGLFYGFRFWKFNSTHVTTDDAYVTTDVVPITARITGNIVDLKVQDNQTVKAGDLLVQIDDATFKADVDQAEANLAAANAALSGAGASVDVTRETSQAKLTQAAGGVSLGSSDVQSAQANVGSAQSAVVTAREMTKSAEANARSAKAGIASKQATLLRAKEDVKSLQAQLQSAQAAVGQAEANLASATANSTNLDKNADRAKMLFDQGVISQAERDQRVSAADSARSQVSAARKLIDMAQATVGQRQAELEAARQSVVEAEQLLVEAEADYDAAQLGVSAQQARVQEAQSGVAAAQSLVGMARARETQAKGTLQEAKAAPKQVSLSEAGRQYDAAKLKQSEAALEAAKIALDRTKVRAPIAGTISRRTAQIGQQVSPGQLLLALIPNGQPWIMANLKETQLANVRVGQSVEIQVDALPGTTLKGHVESLSAGTGSMFSLLPPDNATGNFTKVVQRIPVKIVLEPGQPGLEKLRTGFSVNVAISIRD